jgi:patatin-like phospholipase/acyl hydrolase
VGNDVKGFLFSGPFKKDEVYLASLLITPKYKHAAIILLKRYLSDIMAAGVYKRILVAAVNEASENLAEHLFKFNNVDKDHSEVHNFKLTV